MLRISPALNAGQTQDYHKLEYTSETQSYYKQDGAVEGEWQGRLAEQWGLFGPVTAEQFTRLTEGQHPETGVQLVKHRDANEYKNADGTTTKSVEHRAGWDATFSPPKSVSITALVGGDDRIRQWHEEASTVALNALEKYAQARIGGNNPAETTGKLVIVKFEHDTARPVDGYAAPQLHTHAIVFNMTERADGSTRALQEKALFDSQQYATAVYQSHLLYKMQTEGGYQFETGRSGAPEMKGYSQEYLDASSLRSQQIKDALEKAGQSGYEAANIAARATRDGKQILPREEVLAAHREVAKRFGNQHEKVITEARQRSETQDHAPNQAVSAKEAISYARSSNFEREAVVDERILMRDALRRGMGETTFAHVKAEFDGRHEQGDFRQLKGEKHATGRSFTTPETVANERANVRHVMTGQEIVQPIMTQEQATAQAATRKFLNEAQRAVITDVLTSPDRIHGVQGLAGTGKTTVLASIREGAEQSGYLVEGFAPTSRAAGQLREEGIAATTLQSFLARGQNHPSANTTNPHLYMLDESSLASTKQMRAFLEKIKPEDRVLVVGDTAQHQGVDAGRPFEQMQEAGMRTSQLDQIVRQRKNPELLEALKHLAKGETAKGIDMLAQQGRITEIADPSQRIAAIAKDYAANPERTIIVSPDNQSRQLINQAVRVELQEAGKLGTEQNTFSVLAHRSDMTGADREWAARYKAGDILKYEKGSKTHGIARNSTAVVLSADARNNTVTVQQQGAQPITYDPKRLKGVNAYREMNKEFATGDRIQFTAKDKDLGVNNRDLGTITKLVDGQVTVQMGGKTERTVQFDPAKMRHFDHGYAVTSHVSQGLTEGRVIANIDTKAPRPLINTRLAYVAVSRAEHDARIYTNDAEELGARLATNISKTSAVDFSQKTSKTNSLRDYATSWLKDYKAAITPGEEIKPLPLRGNVLEKALTLALDSDPARVKRVLNLLSHGNTENQTTPSEKKPSRDPHEPPIVRTYADTKQRIAAVTQAYAEHPSNTVVIAKDPAERRELNQLIRADLQATGTVAPDSRSLSVYIEQKLTNPKLAAQYTPGDIIQYRQGSPGLQGIPHDSTAVVVTSDTKTNQLTVKTSNGDETTYSPHITRAMTAQSKVYREEHQEFAQGDRIRLNEAHSSQGIRKGDFGTVAALGDTLDVRLDRGGSVQLNKEQAQYIEHGYAVDNLKTGAPKRILISQDGSFQATSETASLSRKGREVNVYTSDAAVQANAVSSTIALPEQLKPAITLPVQQQSEAPSNALAPEQAPVVQHRHSRGR